MTMVLDTSVIIKWFSYAQEAELEAAQKLRTQIMADTCQIII